MRGQHTQEDDEEEGQLVALERRTPRNMHPANIRGHVRHPPPRSPRGPHARSTRIGIAKERRSLDMSLRRAFRQRADQRAAERQAKMLLLANEFYQSTLRQRSSDEPTKEGFTSPGNVLKQQEELLFDTDFWAPGILGKLESPEFKAQFEKWFDNKRAKEERLQSIEAAESDLLRTNPLLPAGAGSVGGTAGSGTAGGSAGIDNRFTRGNENDRFNKPDITV